MNCTYCQRPCRKVPPIDLGRLGGFVLTGTIEYQCDYHGSVRVRHRPESRESQVISINILLCTIKEDNYAAYFYYQADAPEKFVVYRIPKKKFQPPEKVFALDFHPDIGPENAEKKLPLYFIFS
jgi:hypothetical protein